ncbi:MAG: MFS transporter, partial [Asticcacaulis sp.]
MSQSSLSAARLGVFVLPCLPFAALALPLVVTLPEFYASHLGLDLALVGMVFLLARLFDIATDPIVGILMDRTRTRFGRFRLWLALSLIPLMGAVYMVFFADPGSSMARLVFWLFALYAIFSVSSLSHMSWGAALSPDYHQRSRVFAWWQGANILGMVIALLIPPLVMQTGLGTYVDGVRYMALFILALLPITVGLCVWMTQETIAEAPKTPLKISDYLKLYRRPDVVRILLSDLLLGIAPGITAAMFFFFFEQIKGLDRAQTSIVLLVYFIAGLIG